MRILITGAFGLIGGRLAAHFERTGHTILLGSRRKKSSPPWLTSAQTVQTCWSDEESLEHICKGVDIVIHAAGMNAQDCISRPHEALETNGVNTARLVQASRLAGVSKFIYISTAHVYANPLLGVITEGSCPKNVHPYATSHVAGENTVLYEASKGHFIGLVVRLSNSFGTPMHSDVDCWHLLVNDLCRQAVESGNLVLRSNGIQQRDFIGLNSVCHMIEQIALSSLASNTMGIVNLGTGVSASVLEMARLVQLRCEHVLGFKPDLQHTSIENDKQPHSLYYRIDRLLELGVRPDTVHNIEELDNLLRYCYSTFAVNR